MAKKKTGENFYNRCLETMEEVDPAFILKYHNKFTTPITGLSGEILQFTSLNSEFTVQLKKEQRSLKYPKKFNRTVIIYNNSKESGLGCNLYMCVQIELPKVKAHKAIYEILSNIERLHLKARKIF